MLQARGVVVQVLSPELDSPGDNRVHGVTLRGESGKQMFRLASIFGRFSRLRQGFLPWRPRTSHSTHVRGAGAGRRSDAHWNRDDGWGELFCPAFRCPMQLEAER